MAYSYILLTSAVAPYARMLKVVDGVPAVVPGFTYDDTPAALGRGSAWSPDSKYVAAARTSGVSAAMRMWALDAEDEFREVPSVNLQGTAGTPRDVIWLDDTHILFVSTGGYMVGVFDRVTETITWGSNISLTNVVMASFNRALGRAFIFRSTTPFISVLDWNGTNLTQVNWTGTGPTVAGNAGGVHPGGQLISYGRSTSPWLEHYILAGTVMSKVAVTPGDVDVGATPTAIRWVKDGSHLIVGNNASPRLHIFRKVGNYVTNTNNPLVIIAQVNDIALGDNPDKLLLAINNTNATSGRIQGIDFDGVNDAASLDESFVATVADWSSSILGATWSDDFAPTAIARIYHQTLDIVVEGSFDPANLKIALLSSAAAHDPTDVTFADAAGANEVFGSNWPQGGITMTNVIVDKLAGYETSLKAQAPSVDVADDVTLTFRYALVYDATNDRVLQLIDYGADQTAVQFDRMVFAFPSNVLLRFGDA